VFFSGKHTYQQSTPDISASSYSKTTGTMTARAMTNKEEHPTLIQFEQKLKFNYSKMSCGDGV